MVAQSPFHSTFMASGISQVQSKLHSFLRAYLKIADLTGNVALAPEVLGAIIYVPDALPTQTMVLKKIL